MAYLGLVAGRHICLEYIGGRKSEHVAHAATAVVHDVPSLVEIEHPALAVRVQHVLVIVDIVTHAGELEPLRGGVGLAHSFDVEQQHARLEVAIRVTHLELGLGVRKADAVVHVEVAQVVNIPRGGQQVVTKLGVVELGNVALNDKVGVEVQHLVVARHDKLDDKAVVRLDADVLVVRGKIVLVDDGRHVVEAQRDVVRTGGEVLTHEFLMLPADIAREDHDVVKARLVRVVEHGAHRGGNHGDVAVVGGKDDRNDFASVRSLDGHIKLKMDALGLLKVHALELLGLPICPDALLVHEVDVEQALGKMPRCTQRLDAVVGEVRLGHKTLENREEPLAVRVEDRLAHDEHIAEAAAVPVEEGLCVLGVVGMHIVQDADNVLQIGYVQKRRGLVLGERRVVLAGEIA